jgi:sulfur-oxidizing protein SoxA
MRRLKWSAAAIVACLQLTPLSGEDASHPIPPGELRSGREFVSPATQAEQDDLSVNPGMLWVEQGNKLWHEASGGDARSCASCHGEPSRLRGVATRYPLFDAALGRLLNLEARIQNCRTAHQKSTPLDYESEALLALTALVAFQSRGMPLAVAIPPEAQPAFAAGQALYYERQGQLDLSCAQCHEDNWGKHLRAERISQGHPNETPAVRR